MKTRTVRGTSKVDPKTDSGYLRNGLKEQFEGMVVAQSPSSLSRSSCASSSSSGTSDSFLSTLPSTPSLSRAGSWGIGRTKMGMRPESARGTLEGRGEEVSLRNVPSEDVSYRIAVSSHDGFFFFPSLFSFTHLLTTPSRDSLGYLQMFQESGRFGLSLCSNPQAKEVEFRIEKAEKAPGFHSISNFSFFIFLFSLPCIGCFSFYSVCANAYVGSFFPTPPSDPPPTPQELNYIDITSKEWKIHRNEELCDPQQFGLVKPGGRRRTGGRGSSGELGITIGPSMKPLHFSLQRISNLMKATISVLEEMGIGGAKSPRRGDGKARARAKSKGNNKE